MAVLWQSSLVPFIDPNGDPYAGAQAFFYSAGTSTPLSTYGDGALSVSNDFPVVANASGMFGPIFLQPLKYRLRLETADGVTLWDIDNIDPPEAANTTPPDAGDTDPTLLAKTGDEKMKYGNSVDEGWVRENGLTIGNASSGATERANADTLALFEYLWSQDATLVVSGGRGGTAAGDFAAGKRIALPDMRDRVPIGRGSMGNTAAGLIDDGSVDASETADTLGATVGAATHALTTAEMPSHSHAASVNDPGHAHTLTQNSMAYNVSSTGNGFANGGGGLTLGTVNTNGSGTGVSVSIGSQGSGTAHANVQPGMFHTFLIKL